MRRWLLLGCVGGALVLTTSPSWAARNICEMLRDKGLLNDAEYKECKAAETKEAEKETSKVHEVLMSRLPKWLDVFTPFGDLRNRFEGFYANGLNARNRFRLRARIGLKAKVTDEVAATVRLASGNANDPISTNQTFEKTFTRKSINLDQAYMTLTPGKTFGLRPGVISITGGKFGVNASRESELVWDDDLSPEGATETVNLVQNSDGFFRGLRVNAFQWVVDEISSAGDPWMFGGQIIADYAVEDAAKWSVSFADYHYEDLNAVAARYLEPTSPNFNNQLANSNDVVKDSNGKIIGYRYGFNIVQAGTELDFTDPAGLGIPAGVFGDFAYNTLADTRNVGLYVGFGIGKAGKDYYHDGLKNQGDWGASYTYAYVQKDAVLSLFSYSDIDYVQANATQRGSTNVVAHIVRFDYMLLPNLQLTAKAHFINALDPQISNAALEGNSTLVRTQLDAALKF